MMYGTLSLLVGALIVLAVFGGIAGTALVTAFWFWRANRNARLAVEQAHANLPEPTPPSLQELDRAVPLRFFGQGIHFMLSGGQDYGYFPAHAPASVLSSSWGINDSEGRTRSLGTTSATC